METEAISEEIKAVQQAWMEAGKRELVLQLLSGEVQLDASLLADYGLLKVLRSA